MPAPHPFYKTTEWKKLRAWQLRKWPLCQRCWISRAIAVAAKVVHHKTPHKGDWALFLAHDNLESLCKACHDSDAQAEDIHGHSKAVDNAGYPIDPKHPANRRRPH